MLVVDKNSKTVPAIAIGTSQDVNIASSANNTTAETDSGVSIYQLCSTVDCRIAIGPSATATSTSTLLPAMTPMAFGVRNGDRISVIRVNVDGVLNVTKARD